MKIPKIPPELSFTKFQPENFVQLFQAVPKPTVNGKYLHWDDLLHRTPPAGLNHELWWNMLKCHRAVQYADTPLVDKSGGRFVYL